MKKKVLLIINPKAGKGAVRHALLEMVDIMTKEGCAVTVYPTKDRESMISCVIADAGEYDRVVVCGGDGTLNGVVNGILSGGIKKPIGYIPMGTTNDFAVSLGISSDFRKAAKDAVAAFAAPHDAGRFNGEYFTYIACAGAFAETSYATSQNLKNRLGHSAYLLSSLKSLSTIRKTYMAVSTPDFSITGDFLFVSLSNSLNAGGVLNLSRTGVVFDDGEFELLLIKMPKDFIEFSALIVDLLGANMANKNIILKKVNECRILCERPVGWSLDGEDGGLCDDVRLSVAKRALSICGSNTHPEEITGDGLVAGALMPEA